MEEICRPTFLTWVGTGALLSKNEVFFNEYGTFCELFA